MALVATLGTRAFADTDDGGSLDSLPMLDSSVDTGQQTGSETKPPAAADAALDATGGGDEPVVADAAGPPVPNQNEGVRDAQPRGVHLWSDGITDTFNGEAQVVAQEQLEHTHRQPAQGTDQPGRAGEDVQRAGAGTCTDGPCSTEEPSRAQTAGGARGFSVDARSELTDRSVDPEDSSAHEDAAGLKAWAAQMPVPPGSLGDSEQGPWDLLATAMMVGGEPAGGGQDPPDASQSESERRLIEGIKYAVDFSAWYLQRPPLTSEDQLDQFMPDGVPDEQLLAFYRLFGELAWDTADDVWTDRARQQLEWSLGEIERLWPQGPPEDVVAIRDKALEALGRRPQQMTALDQPAPSVPGYGQVEGDQVSQLPGITAAEQVPGLPGTTPTQLDSGPLRAQATSQQQATGVIPANSDPRKPTLTEKAAVALGVDPSTVRDASIATSVVLFGSVGVLLALSSFSPQLRLALAQGALKGGLNAVPLTATSRPVDG